MVKSWTNEPYDTDALGHVNDSVSETYQETEEWKANQAMFDKLRYYWRTSIGPRLQKA